MVSFNLENLIVKAGHFDIRIRCLLVMIYQCACNYTSQLLRDNLFLELNGRLQQALLLL